MRIDRIHLKNFKLLQTNSTEELIRFGFKSFQNNRYCFLICEINSSWTFPKLLKSLNELSIVVVDCQKMDFLMKNNKAESDAYLNLMLQSLKNVLQNGGVIIVNVDDPGKREYRKSLDVDFKDLLNTYKFLAVIFNIKSLKSKILLNQYFQLDNAHKDCTILIYSKWKMPQTLSDSNIRSKINNRFQYICNIHWGDVLILK